MGDVTTGPDGLQVMLTGAPYTGGVQLDPAASLGGYRSMKRAEALLVHRFRPLTHTVVEWVSGYNGSGLGVLEAVDTDSLRWTAPGGTPGTAVTIANGERKVLVDGTTAGAFVVVRRISALDLGGREVVQLLPYLHNVAGMSDFTVDDAVGTALHRAVMFHNAGDAAITNLRVWAESTNALTRYRAETPDANGALTEIPDERTSPGGTFLRQLTEGVATQIASSLEPSEQIGLWLRREKPNNTYAISTARWHYRWTCGGVTYYGTLAGRNRVPRASAESYRIWISAGAPPDSENTYADYATYTLPYTVPENLNGPETWYIHVRKRSIYELTSPAQEIILRVDADDAALGTPPSGPLEVRVSAGADGTALIEALYSPRAEAETWAAAEALRADEWVIYVKSGEAPDPDVDAAVATVAMRGGRNREQLSYTTTGYLEGTPIYVLVRTRRNDGDDETPAWVYSENTDSHSVDAEWWGPHRVHGAISLGRALGVRQSPVTAPDEQVDVDVAKGVYWEVTDSGTRLYADGVLVWNLRYDGPGLEGNGLYTTFDFREGTVSGTAAALVEFGTWDAGAKEIFIRAGTDRRLKIDVVAKTITVAGLTQITAPVGSLADDPVWERYEETDFQCWNASDEEYVTGMALVAGGLRMAVDWKQRATEAECL